MNGEICQITPQLAEPEDENQDRTMEPSHV
jgi:hypothetical protein